MLRERGRLNLFTVVSIEHKPNRVGCLTLCFVSLQRTKQHKYICFSPPPPTNIRTAGDYTDVVMILSRVCMVERERHVLLYVGVGA